MYQSIVRHPWRWLSALVILLLFIGGMTVYLFLQHQSDPWTKSLVLAQTLLLLGSLLVLWPYAIATVAQFLSESTQRLKENKPVVFTDALVDEPGSYQIHNVGSAPAVNVWYLEEGERPIPLGSLAAGESGRLSEDLVQRLKRAGDHRHLLFGEARPHTGRPWTVSINVRTDTPGGVMLHGFAVPDQIDRNGTIDEFLEAEREVLFRQLRGKFPITPCGSA